VIEVTGVLLALSGAGFLIRLVIGPSLADRVVALDGLLIVIVAVLAIDAARTGRGWFTDVAVVVGLLGYVGMCVSARFIERRGA